MWQNPKPELFMIKTVGKLGIKRNSLNLIKIIYRKNRANIINSEKLEAFPLRLDMRQKPLTTSAQHCIGNHCWCSKTRKEKGTQIGKEEIKLFLFTDDTVICVENPKESTVKQKQMFLELISNYSNTARYKANIQSKALSHMPAMNK